MVGASLAVALADLPLRIAVIEPLPLGSEAQPSFDERTIALNAASRVIFQTLGVWPGMAADAAVMRSIAAFVPEYVALPGTDAWASV